MLSNLWIGFWCVNFVIDFYFSYFKIEIYNEYNDKCFFVYNIYFNHVEALRVKCCKKSSSGSNEEFIIGIWNLTIFTNIVILGQLQHKLNYLQLCQKLFKNFSPFLKFSKTHSSYQPILNQGLAWPNQLLYIHLATNVVKYF